MALDAQSLLIQRLREQRLRWVDTGPGRRVQVLVLRETELPQLRNRPLVDVVCDQAVAWEGYTEATLLGAAIGASDPLPFTPELWAEVARGSIDTVGAVGDVLIGEAKRVMEARAESRKN